jgi:hypothetical protein
MRKKPSAATVICKRYAPPATTVPDVTTRSSDTVIVSLIHRRATRFETPVTETAWAAGDLDAQLDSPA